MELSEKQLQIARAAAPFDRITAADFKALKSKKPKNGKKSKKRR
mgnify:CR=1 FL=1|tara:strand:- start:122 stop:253 length:132 start_codon:yes stop_codon:yes gene_type:complete